MVAEKVAGQMQSDQKDETWTERCSKRTSNFASTDQTSACKSPKTLTINKKFKSKVMALEKGIQQVYLS